MNVFSQFVLFVAAVAAVFPVLIDTGDAFERQEYDFCGEVSVSIMLGSLGEKAGQHAVHEKIFGLPRGSRGAYSGEIVEALRQRGYGLSVYEDFSHASRESAASVAGPVLEEIKTEVAGGRAVFTAWYPWESVSGRTAHFSVVTGIYGEGVIVSDPRFADRVLFIPDREFAETLPVKSLDDGTWGFFHFTMDGRSAR